MPKKSLLLVGAGLISTLVVIGAANAGWNERVPPVKDAATAKECGECHFAFQPALLPAPAWRAIMGDLEHHFGDNAKLPADAATAIAGYLTANAGGGDAAQTRITRQGWFAREHRRQRPPNGKSMANCDACHRDAARGLFEED